MKNKTACSILSQTTEAMELLASRNNNEVWWLLRVGKETPGCAFLWPMDQNPRHCETGWGNASQNPPHCEMRWGNASQNPRHCETGWGKASQNPPHCEMGWGKASQKERAKLSALDAVYGFLWNFLSSSCMCVLCVYVCLFMPRHACGRERTTSENWLPPSILWITHNNLTASDRGQTHL